MDWKSLSHLLSLTWDPNFPAKSPIFIKWLHFFLKRCADLTKRSLSAYRSPDNDSIVVEILHYAKTVLQGNQAHVKVEPIRCLWYKTKIKSRVKNDDDKACKWGFCF